MKHLLSILLISSICLTQEMEVDGDLKVTGNIQNQMIDSLLQVIQDLQSQLSVLQGGVSQRVIDVTIEDGGIVNLQSLFPDYNLEWAIINIANCPTVNCIIQNTLSTYSMSQMRDVYNNGGIGYIGNQTSSVGSFYINNPNSFKITFDTPGETNTIKLLFTAEFPTDSDVQLRKTGLQSKDKKTVK